MLFFPPLGGSYLDLPKGAEWMIRGANKPSFRIKQHPNWKMLVPVSAFLLTFGVKVLLRDRILNDVILLFVRDPLLPSLGIHWLHHPILRDPQ